jgi:hypothetical protein
MASGDSLSGNKKTGQEVYLLFPVCTGQDDNLTITLARAPLSPRALFDGSLDFSGAFTFGNSVALVVQSLAASETDLHLGTVVFEVHPQGYDCQSLFLDASHEAQDLAVMHQESAITIGIDVLAAGGFIGSNVDVQEPQLAISDLRITVAEIHTAGADGLDLGPS